MAQATMTPEEEWQKDLRYHDGFFPTEDTNPAGTASRVHREEIKTTPFFSAEVLAKVLETSREPGAQTENLLTQYGLLAKVLHTFNSKEDEDTEEAEVQGQASYEEALDPAPDGRGSIPEPEDKRLFVNMNAPWSAFICGSQGSGKSHTLSCMLEAALRQPDLGKLPNPLSAIVFHYDKFNSCSSSQICEAAYLSSSGIPVKVLVSPSNYKTMKKAYENMPGFPEDAKKPVVAPLVLFEEQLNLERMMTLMAAEEKDGKMPLYMESVRSTLRAMAMTMDNEDAHGINFADFEKRIEAVTPNENQRTMLDSRIKLLRGFFLKPTTGKPQNGKKKEPDNQQQKDQATVDAYLARYADKTIWDFKAGELTIVDLSCPFVEEGAACALFNICLQLFLEGRQDIGRLVALDEAHKYMTATSSSSHFTESLLSVVRQQRHLATRVIIATQEPTISPALLDLSSMTIVHRFTSPSWLTVLKSHLAGLSIEGETSKRDIADVFKQIVKLEAGQALLFSPSGMTGVDPKSEPNRLKMQKLGVGYLKIGVRARLTKDGGRSILATSLQS
uniref:Uncharacterized protein n=1 Tax=Cladonia uncialis subsp. uncialis TaxID=180999 RepID=A0A1Z1C502_CLAUC|nr:hypothetical protein [Cladonia uncialis subsp. uncialis]AUW30873.1 hypothetical protein [Cladonia uncialis subsp. uncialis]